MRTLIYIYVVTYVLISAWTIIEDVKYKEPWWDVALDVILLPLGGIGILLFLASVNDPSIKSAWQVISILIVGGQLIAVVITRHLTLVGKKDLNRKRVSQWGILAADLTAMVLLAPMFALNLIFAFS